MNKQKLGEPLVYLKPVEQTLCSATVPIKKSAVERLTCVAVCCGVLRCVAVCCGVLQGVAVCCSVWWCVSVSCSELQCSLQ